MYTTNPLYYIHWILLKLHYPPTTCELLLTTLVPELPFMITIPPSVIYRLLDLTLLTHAASAHTQHLSPRTFQHVSCYLLVYI